MGVTFADSAVIYFAVDVTSLKLALTVTFVAMAQAAIISWAKTSRTLAAEFILGLTKGLKKMTRVSA